jgi:hypothetical protein
MPTTTNVIDMPVEQVTEAIVAAAKRVRKPKAEITIVEQIVSDILAGKFAEEAATQLKQIFGDEFCIKRGLMEKPKKARKPKAQKVVFEEPIVEGEEKPKKVRKQKTPKIVSEEPGVSEEKPKEKKVRKPKAPKVVVEPISEAVVSESFGFGNSMSCSLCFIYSLTADPRSRIASSFTFSVKCGVGTSFLTIDSYSACLRVNWSVSCCSLLFAV